MVENDKAPEMLSFYSTYARPNGASAFSALPLYHHMTTIHRWLLKYFKIQLWESIMLHMGVLSGEEFVEKYLDHNDSVTTIDKEHNYAVRPPTRHPIYENFRVKAFKALLSAAPSNYQLSALGELMYQLQCLWSWVRWDRLVNLVKEMQHSQSSESEDVTLFGAKITGGGSGGTVCVIGRNCLRSNEQIIEIQQRYKAATGFSPYVFEGSSPGAAKFGHLNIRLRSSSKEYCD